MTTTFDPAKFNRLEDEVNDCVLERGYAIHTGVLALMGRRHHVVLGAPGIAKSLMVTELHKRVTGANKFDILMTRYTEPNELFGAPRVKRLIEDDVYQRNTEMMLPEAHIAMLDEGFKANSSILNAMLRLINERQFFNHTADPTVPLISLFMASNELPESEELNAFFDRLTYRHNAEGIHEDTNWVTMLNMEHDPNPEPVVTLEDLHVAAQFVNSVEVPSTVIDGLRKLRKDLTELGITVSDRRWRECMTVIRSEAAYQGRTVAKMDDTRVLAHVLWTDPKDIQTVWGSVFDLSDPVEREAMDALSALDEAYNQYKNAMLDELSTAQKDAKVSEMNTKVYRSKKVLVKLTKKNNGRPSEMTQRLAQRLKSISEAVLAEIGLDDEDDAMFDTTDTTN